MKQHETRPDWREWRRQRAWALKQQGWKQQAIAQALGVTKGAVSQWMARARTGGVEALRRRLASGRPPKLSPEQVRRLPDLLGAGAEAYGFRGQVWTTKRITHLMGLRLGVRYHPAHVSRLVRAVGWSVQQPIQRATQRNEAAIKAWREERWPALKKRPRRNSAPSSGWINRLSICCLWRYAPTLPEGRHPSCGSHSHVTISRRSVASPPMGGCSCTCRIMPIAPKMSSGFSGSSCAKSLAISW